MIKQTLMTICATTCIGAGLVQAQGNFDWTFEDPTKLTTSINSEGEDIMPLISPDGSTMYFVRAMHEGNTAGKDGGHDIWMSKRSADGNWGKATNELPNLNNDQNNAVIGVSKENSSVFLLNAYKQQRVGDDERGISVSENKSGNWSKPSFVKVPDFKTNTNFQTFFVAPEGDLMIMAVNIPGSLGQEDLYVSKLVDGKWSVPTSLGSTINSKGFEMSPFLSADRKHLYFSTDGRGGQGNADVFVSERMGDSWTSWSEPMNLGDKINSSAFDAYLTMGSDSTYYFCSTRDGSMSDIYSVRIKPEDPPLVDIPPVTDTITEILTPDEPINPPYSAQNIFFENNEYSLSSDAKKKLDELAAFMAKHENSKCDVSGHADVKASHEHNDRLSRNRAKAAKRYLESKGIASSRLNVMHHGETKPAVACPEQDCTDAQHQANRRVEFAVRY